MLQQLLDGEAFGRVLVQKTVQQVARLLADPGPHGVVKVRRLVDDGRAGVLEVRLAWAG